ncbi:OmpA family protein [Pseudoxanthomonas sp. LH2527]|uniref:OmpA family protein n=1 Tax=Pseudoxanthomonas sp. LH2527 TaxID=2923249 RepID=UPI001F12F8F1|nr:OmpA family protein [Pseudoxanthomonas sp. LH2527]MCH6483913.1 OmpA family protein [Pseudoxanthomonas sp. LH2527]
MSLSSKRRPAVPLWIACAVGLALSACGTRHVSHDISPAGVAGEVVFPDPADVLFNHGTFPNRDNLRAIAAGVTKPQLYDLLGRPHFREGLRAREWDYLFHFRTAQGLTTCQYKVLFDRDYTGRSFHWAPASCAALLDAPAAAPTAATNRFELSGDALFAFDRHAVADILPGGREQIAAIAAELRDSNISSLQVIGHTDLLGDDRYNHRLSQQRALSVRSLLIEQGIAPAMVTALGAGESQPLKTCDATLALPARIACEQPNRRVEVLAHGVR